MTAHRENALAREASPYLLQHARNPVDWRPWGPEAFAEARRRDVPLFVSIGYSTCYWCHVMERECFEDEAIARVMNELFVCVKVDREERPDVDDVYMAATVMSTGHGGWPMSVFVEPSQLRPFWCGTYFPPEPRGQMPGFPHVLRGIASAWREQRPDVEKQAEAMAQAVRDHLATPPPPRTLGLAQVEQAVQLLLRLHDRTHGGFGGAPKFPQPLLIEFLLEVRESASDEATRHSIDSAIRLTLDKMAIGGLFDQAGGGFHRYCVDATWTVPHFEKMLYDNAMLMGLYARASKVYDDAFYARIARETMQWALREMRSPEGVFFSALDAEVNHREGLNYLWTPEEFAAALSPDDAAFALKVYGLDKGPNFRDPHHPDEPARSVLRLADRPERLAAGFGLAADAFNTRLDAIRARLLEVRADRSGPARDDKVIVAWNGLMIGALAQVHDAMRDEQALKAAVEASTSIMRLSRRDGRLHRTWRNGQLGPCAVLEDIGCLAWGQARLGRTTAAAGESAASLLEAAGEYRDDAGNWFDTASDATNLFVRTRSTHDGAMPSGSSMLLHTFIELATATGDRRWVDQGLHHLASLSGAIADSPVNAIHATTGLLRLMRLGAVPATSDDAGAPRPPSAAADGFTSVEVFADVDRVSVGADRPALVRLAMQIAPGHHLIAADPGSAAPGLRPLRVGITNGTGVVAYADYPPGEPDLQGVNLYHGRIEFEVALEASGEWKGRPILVVDFQACTQTECLPPRTVELDLAIDRA